MLPLVAEILIKIVIVLAGLMTAAAYLVLVERWVAAWVQDRRGPNRVGIPLTKVRLFGLGQPIADGVKLVFKEESPPAHVDKFLFIAAPVTMFTAAVLAFAVIPFGSLLPFEGAAGPIRLVIAPGLDVGLIYLLAVGSIAVYGVILGGWASNNKYSFLGGLRSSAQLIAYELPLGLALLGVAVASGSLRLEDVVQRQAAAGLWNAMVQPLGFVVFCVAATAEAARLPFDLAECEQELIAGYHTEYSGIKLMMYLVSDFLHMITAAFLISILFLGGWHLWGITGADESVGWGGALLRIAVLMAKVLGVILFFMLIRWSWPRFRFDQLMGLAWNAMLPLGLVNLVAAAVWLEYGPRLARAAGLGPGSAEAALGWGVLAAAWLAVVLLAPAAADNRPRREDTAWDEGLPL